MQKASLTEADHERCSTHRDPDENNFNGPSYITRLSYSLFRSSLALDRCLEKRTRGGVNANLRRREKEKEKEEEVEKVEEEKEKNEARKEREREKREEKERETRTREPFVSLAPANTELAAACRRRLLCRSHEEDARLLLCSPFVSYWEGHTVVCGSPLHRAPLFSSLLHEWKDVGILTVKVWLLTTRGGSRTAVESSAARLFAAYDRPPLSRAFFLPSPLLSGNRSLILSIDNYPRTRGNWNISFGIILILPPFLFFKRFVFGIRTRSKGKC